MQIRTRVLVGSHIVAEAAIAVPDQRSEGWKAVSAASEVIDGLAGLATATKGTLLVEMVPGVPTQNGGRAMAVFTEIEGEGFPTGAQLRDDLGDWVLSVMSFED